MRLREHLTHVVVVWQTTTKHNRHATIASERPGKLSDRTLHGYARGIRAFFTWLVTEDYLATNPMLRLKPPKLEKRYKQVLSVAEVERLLNQLNPRTFLGARMYAMVALLYDSGLRATAGIPRLPPHLLRHSAAVAYIMNGGDQFGLKRILGHTQLATTDIYMDYQQHLAQQHQRFSPMARVHAQRANPPKRRTKR